MKLTAAHTKARGRLQEPLAVRHSQKDKPSDKPLKLALTLNEASEAVGVCRRFLEGEISAGHLRVMKFGTRCTRVRQEDLNRWMEAHLV
jgi:excisionase family DNA binding protein